MIKYGNFSGRVTWDTCFLEVESPLGKHFLQGNGSEAGVLENVIVSRGENGKYRWKTSEKLFLINYCNLHRTTVLLGKEHKKKHVTFFLIAIIK